MTSTLPRVILLAGTLGLMAAGCSSAAPAPAPAPAPISIRGTAYTFSMSGGVIPNAQVSILELPGHQTVTAADGTFQFAGLPAGSDLTFLLHAPGVADTLTGTFNSATDVDNLTFQAPDFNTYNLLATVTSVMPRSDRCQIATTVTRQGVTGNDTGGNGEPDATASIDPPLPDDAVGPVYFNTGSGSFIYPDPNLTHTSTDGGVLFLNVPPGDHILRAQKEGTTFSEVHIKCLAGQLTNASPPWGVRALSGGIGPKPDAGG